MDVNREDDDPVFEARPRNVQHYRAARQVPSLVDAMEPLEPAEGPRPADRRSSLAPIALPTAEPCPACDRPDCVALNHR